MTLAPKLPSPWGFLTHHHQYPQTGLSCLFRVDPHLYHLNNILQKAQRLHVNNTRKVTSVLTIKFTNLHTGSPGLGPPAGFLAHLHLPEPTLLHLGLAGAPGNPGREEGGPGKVVFPPLPASVSPRVWFLPQDFFAGCLTAGLWAHWYLPPGLTLPLILQSHLLRNFTGT